MVKTKRPGGRPRKTLKEGENVLFCSKCGKSKALDSFSIDKRSGVGYQTACKECEKKYRLLNIEARRTYIERTKKERASSMRQYYLANAKKINAWRRNYYSEKGHLAIRLANESRRAQKVTTDDGSITAEAIEVMFLYQNGCCVFCHEEFHHGQKGFHIDHIVPLSMGGKHILKNIQLLCPKCNLQKGAKVVETYNNAGRSIKYDPDFVLSVMEKMMKEGASIEEVCLELEVSKNSLYRWLADNQELSDAKKRIEEFSQAWWLKKGRKNINNSFFNSALWFMNMKNRFGWRDKQDFSVTTKDFKYVQFQYDNTKQLKNEAERLAQEIVANRRRTYTPKED